MNKTIDALKLAKKALIGLKEQSGIWLESDDEALAAIREVLAKPDIEEMTLTQIASRHEPVQEPVACIRWIPKLENVRSEYFEYGWSDGKKLPVGTQLYAAPAERKWVDLTDDEIDEIESKILMAGGEHNDIYRAVIAADRELNK